MEPARGRPYPTNPLNPCEDRPVQRDRLGPASSRPRCTGTFQTLLLMKQTLDASADDARAPRRLSSIVSPSAAALASGTLIVNEWPGSIALAVGPRPCPRGRPLARASRPGRPCGASSLSLSPWPGPGRRPTSSRRPGPASAAGTSMTVAFGKLGGRGAEPGGFRSVELEGLHGVRSSRSTTRIVWLLVSAT